MCGSKDAVIIALHIVLAIAVLSLFTPFKTKLANVELRPFDILTGVLFLGVLFRLNRLPAPRTWAGLVIMIPYLAWHVTSAFLYYTANGERELLQIAIVLMFSFSLASLLPVMNYRLLGVLMLAGMALITLCNAGYHISLGFWMGWKRLEDPKFTFEFLPPVLGAFLVFSPRRAKLGWWTGWLLFGVLIVLSGERKALIEFCVMTAILALTVRALIATPIFCGIASILVLLASRIQNGYLGEQLHSLTRFTVNPHNNYDMIIRGSGPASLSDAQRIFAFHVGAEMLKGHWLFGVGTNAYQDRVEEEFAFLPHYLLNGVHGEFWNVLVQNGIFGFALYLTVWLTAAIRLALTLYRLCRIGAINAYIARVLWAAVFVPALLFVGFEAAGTHAFITLFFVSISAELICYALKDHIGRAAPARRPAPAAAPQRWSARGRA